MTTPVAARKNRYGSRIYPVPIPGTEDVVDLPSVTGLLKELAAPGLEIWRQKLIAEQFALQPDLIMLAANPDTRWDAIQQALNSSRSSANTGTAIHFWTELVDDETLDWGLVPEVAKPWVQQYVNAKERHGWKMVDKEFSIYQHDFGGWAGTSDRILDLPGYGKVIADVKTSANVYGDMALQMAFYAFAEGIWIPPAPDTLTESDARDAQLENDIATGSNIPPGRRIWSQDAIKQAKAEAADLRWREYARKGKHVPLPADLRKDVAIIIHLHQDSCELIPLDLTGCEDVVKGIARIHHWKARKDVVGQPIKIQPVDAVRELRSIKDGLQGKESDRVAAVADSLPDLSGAEEVPVSETPDASTRRSTIQTRIDALALEVKRDLAFRWPDGVPTLKKSDGHSPEQLQAIEDVLWDIECKSAVELVTSSFPGSTIQ